MTRRRLFLFLALAVTVVGLVSAGWLLWPRPNEPPEFSRIREGMTRAEIDAVFGRGRDRAHGGGTTGFPEIGSEWDTDDDGRRVVVVFDNAGKVQGKSYIPPLSPPPLLDRIRIWLGL
jgi:hypothetical protein